MCSYMLTCCRHSGLPILLQKHISREDALASIKADYECNYFVSGSGELAAYDPDCEFRDDFASFNGVGEWHPTWVAVVSIRNVVQCRMFTCG